MSTIPIDRLNAALGGRYRLEGEVGAGGMATVFLARDLRHDRKVALKVLEPELAAAVGAERFLAEIKTTANLHHPHILPLFDSGEADGFLFYVMPYVDGETLADRLARERQLPVDEAIDIATAVASALQHAHDKGVVHRDIKPGNILLQDGQPVVSDFGIALAVGSAGDARLTETGLSVGTPYYISPEQATGDRVVGPTSDVFSLGCVLYEMLVGDPPYAGSTAQAVLGRIIQGVPVSARSVRDSVPPNVDAAIRKALEKLPADRFVRVADFAEALRTPGFRHGETSTGVGAPVRGWNRLTTVFAALTLVLGVVAAWALTADDTPSTVERFGDPFLDGQEPTRTGLGIFSLAPDGSGVVYVGRGEMPGTIRLYLRRWADLESTSIRGTEGGDQPAISPDGRELAFHRGNEVFVAPVEGGAVRSLGPGRWPHWDEAGGVYATVDGVGSVRYPVTGGTADTILRLQPEHEDLFVWSVLPGERRALVLVNAGNGALEVHAADLETGELRFLTPGTEPSFVGTGHLLFRLDGSLVAAPFDPDAMELEGPPVALEPDVTAYSVSRDGRLLYSLGSTVASTERQLVWVDRSGGATPVDSAWTFTQGDVNTSWDISPDGSRLALREVVDGAYDIWVKRLDDGPRSRLTFDRAGDYHPRWSPDGQRIVYLTGATTGLDVWTRRADGAGEPQLLLDAEESIALAFWSPDAEWLILRTTTGSGNVFGRDIRAFRPGVDSVPVPLLVEAHDEMDPALSPDGRWLAYQSNETGSFEVYVRPFPDVGGGRWQISVDGGHGPRWAHDGREIFFRDGSRNMVAAEVDGSGSDFRARAPRVLFPIPDDYLRRRALDAFRRTPRRPALPDGPYRPVGLRRDGGEARLRPGPELPS